MSELFCVNDKNSCNIFIEKTDNCNEKKNIIKRKCNIHQGVLKTESSYKTYCVDSPINLQENNIKILKDRDIIDAIKNDHLKRFIKLLQESNRDKENINISIDYNYQGNTLLHEAIFWNSNKCILYLLKQSSDMVNISNKDGNSVFHIACLKGNSFLINELYKLGSDISSINKRGETILHCAIKSGIYEIVYHVFNIMNNPTCLSCLDSKGRNALHIAVICKNKNYEIIDFLIKKGSDLINTDFYGKSILQNLNKLEKNTLNLRIKTLLIKSFYKLYKNTNCYDQSSNSENYNFCNMLNNVKTNDSCYKQPDKKKKSSLNLYSYLICRYPEYSPFKTNYKKLSYDLVNTFNVEYNENDTNLLNENNFVKKKVLPIKYKKYFEDFQNYSNIDTNDNKKKQLNKKEMNSFSKIIVILIILFILLFLFIYE